MKTIVGPITWEEIKGKSDTMWHSFSPAATFNTFHSIMLSLSGDTAGLVSHLEKNIGDYHGPEKALFMLGMGRDGGEEWRMSDGCNRVDREIWRMVE